jgi:hypothetical protein
LTAGEKIVLGISRDTQAGVMPVKMMVVLVGHGGVLCQ